MRQVLFPFLFCSITLGCGGPPEPEAPAIPAGFTVELDPSTGDFAIVDDSVDGEVGTTALGVPIFRPPPTLVRNKDFTGKVVSCPDCGSLCVSGESSRTIRVRGEAVGDITTRDLDVLGPFWGTPLRPTGLIVTSGSVFVRGWSAVNTADETNYAAPEARSYDQRVQSKASVQMELRLGIEDCGQRISLSFNICGDRLTFREAETARGPCGETAVDFCNDGFNDECTSSAGAGSCIGNNCDNFLD